MPSKLDMLTPLGSMPVQAYFSSHVQLSDVIDWVLSQIGPSRLIISTYSTSEEFLRHLIRLKSSGLVLSCTLICDHRAVRKTLNLYNIISSVCDEVYLCENHSKVVLFLGSARTVSIVSSQNQTRGNRAECGVISTIPRMNSFLKHSLYTLINKSRKLHELL